mmetsp:Transcript_16699/g.29566  ORF Transcript_16699/g.29566 Transcript_16699/m.29566 type:complete len:112 (+) Transcript_16699:116-451(+)|eukprot:CAMPEP_0184528744 /NCGR_PEP_ID=MMETSP0198_2-20121128/11963_1 /TAXON_ID=1112570 /ORGANISM="Thraustochytrium sp., Strain LLF1b" /LENGTH=111 /DNA_ID=CAMNT_0026920627 /DNA_START=112 /DNA_END=447 /DNA_ORIENTATION=-
MATDRFNVNVSLSNNWEHLENKFVGTGNPDITKFEWGVNMQRDTLASHLGHADMMSFFAVAENESIERVRNQLLTKMVEPCGPPPEVGNEEDHDDDEDVKMEATPVKKEQA